MGSQEVQASEGMRVVRGLWEVQELMGNQGSLDNQD